MNLNFVLKKKIISGVYLRLYGEAACKYSADLSETGDERLVPNSTEKYLDERIICFDGTSGIWWRINFGKINDKLNIFPLMSRKNTTRCRHPSLSIWTFIADFDSNISGREIRTRALHGQHTFERILGWGTNSQRIIYNCQTTESKFAAGFACNLNNWLLG